MLKLSAKLRWHAQNIFGGDVVGYEEKKSALVSMRFSMIVVLPAIIIKTIRLLARVRNYIEARIPEKQTGNCLI